MNHMVMNEMAWYRFKKQKEDIKGKNLLELSWSKTYNML